MGNEASKTKAIWKSDFVKTYFSGKGIDIGCGNDPIFPNAVPFDQAHGDANKLSEYFEANSFDYIFSSHCLEHMIDPKQAFGEWLKVLKPGGHAVILVPDEDLYEQGKFPSIFNDDHKHTFNLDKEKSWSPVSINLRKFLTDFPVEVVSLEKQDQGYDHGLQVHNPNYIQYRLGRLGMKGYKAFKRLKWAKDSSDGRVTNLGLAFVKFFSLFGGVYDQSSFADSRLSQIQFIARKK